MAQGSSLPGASPAIGLSDARVAPAAAKGAPHLELRGLRQQLGDRVVLQGLSLRVQRGEIYGLLGPNGSGKSTTLRVLTGMLRPDAGEILLDGEAVEAGGRKLRQRLGVVFQSGSLDSRLTARENLLLSAGALRPAARHRRRAYARAARVHRARGARGSPRARSTRAACAAGSSSRARSCTSRRCS